MKNHALNKWMIQRISAVALLPLLLFFLYSLINLVNQDYTGALDFFDNYLPIIIFTLFLILSAVHFRLGLNEIIEDYVEDERLKNIINKVITLYSTILPIIGVISLIKIIL
jgi:succinate dehydrogenase / fumarate reductase membrane anchor subunit